MSFLNKKYSSNGMMFVIASIIAIINQALLPILDKEYIDPKLYKTYVLIQVFSIIFYLCNLLISKIFGYRDLYVHIFIVYTFVWGIICQFLIPSAYLTYVICLFVYTIFFTIEKKTFFSLTIVSFVLTCCSIFYSTASYSSSPEMTLKFKTDAIQTLFILSVFILMTYHNKDKNLKKLESIESKLFNLGSHTSTVVHDLKSLIFPPLNYVTMLSSKDFSESEKDELLTELSFCLNNLKDYALELNQMFALKKEKGELNLELLVTKILILLQSKSKNLKINQTQDALFPINDLKSFQAMTYNLVVNSCEAFKPNNNTSINNIYLSLINNKFTYQDSSGGIPANILAKIKNKEFGTEKKEGSGLGMFFVIKYIEDNGWDYSISNKDNGFCLEITLS